MNSMLINFNNSCYMDVVLYSLLKLDINCINKEILNKNINDTQLFKIQYELKKIKYRLQTGEKFTCDEFRNLIKGYKTNSYEDFSDGSPRSSEEFLLYLFSIFKVEIGFNKQWTFVSHVPINKPIDNENSILIGCIDQTKTSPVFNISHELLLKKGDNSIRDLIMTTDDCEVDKYIHNGEIFKRVIQITIPIDYDLFIINIERMIMGNRIILNKVIPNEELRFINANKVLKLFSIIVWHNGHYTSFIKLDENWYYYNDINIQGLTLVGSFEKLLSNELILKFSILFFYSVF
jgi:ubiquitin C-terminal hydrolase